MTDMEKAKELKAQQKHPARPKHLYRFAVVFEIEALNHDDAMTLIEGYARVLSEDAMMGGPYVTYETSGSVGDRTNPLKLGKVGE